MANNSLVKALEEVLGNVFSMYVRTHGAHWNVRGSDFAQYHELFETIYEDVYGSIDPLAENIRKLDADAPASLADFNEFDGLAEAPVSGDSEQVLAQDIIDANRIVLESLDKAFKIANEENQQGIANFLAERIDMHQKWKWQLSASMSKSSSFDSLFVTASGDFCSDCGENNWNSCFWCGGKGTEKDGSTACGVCSGKGKYCKSCAEAAHEDELESLGDEQRLQQREEMERDMTDKEKELYAEFSDSLPQARASVEKEAMDNPFGYGPFVSDDPLVSEQYSHDNPANNVGPYNGPSSYSINTVAPYKGEEEENPAQNVGPYMPPSVRNQMLEETFSTEGAPKDVRKAYKQWVNEGGWFDGSSNSVYNRIAQAQVIRKQARLANDTETEFELEEQILTLSKVANELDEFNLNDYMEELPGGTVALEYEDITDGGLVDLGSFISVESSRIFTEAKDYDWDKFTKAGANLWVRERVGSNPGLLRHETDTRRAAIDYVKSKTMVLTDPIRRAEVIDEFVNNVERARRQAAVKLEETDRKLVERVEGEVQQLLRQAKEELDSEPKFSNSKELTPDVVNGRLNIGEDDGSLLYTAAVESMEAMEEDWPTFTTEGARDWFWDKASSGPMWKYEDSTRRAAKEYALSRTAAVHDSTLRNEIIRAFCASVEFMRKVYSAKTANQEVVDEEAESYQVFDSIFGNEDEIIW